MPRVTRPDESVSGAEDSKSPPPGEECSRGSEQPDKPNDSSAALRRAYDERTIQLHDARGALAEAVAALTVELARRREESAALLDERERAFRENRALRERAGELEAALEAARTRATVLAEMKVVRYTAWPRRLVYRLRARRR